MQNLCFGCMKPYDRKLRSCPHCGYVPGTRPLEANHIMPGTVLKNGHYVVGRALGSGGFGVTYIGYDFALSQTVAIKEYLPGEFATRMPNQTQLTVGGGEKGKLFSEGKKSFIDESRKLMKFQDVPEIVHVFDCFEGNGTAYIVMEYLDGETLRARLAKSGKMSPEEALPIMTDVLHALEKVHHAGMLHRDVAPDNIFLTKDGKTKLIDFGAARFTTMEGTKSLTVMLKPGFTPLEQYAASGGQGPWTDVYAAAATLYAMLTGVVPLDAVERSANDTLKPPRKMGAKISGDMENAILNAMQVKAQFRTQTAQEFERQLESSGVGRVHDKSSRPKNRLPLWAKLVAALGTLCVAVLVGLITYVVTHPYNPITGYETERNGQVIVPDFLNLTESKARETAERRGLKLSFSEQQASGRKVGVVLDQPSGHGNYVDKGTVVNLVLGVGSGMVEVIPDVVGLDADAAIAKLKSQGFEVQSIEAESIAAPGTIALQSHQAGDELDKGSVVVLTVSTGKEGGDSTKVEKVEDLTGMTYEEAASDAYDKHKHYIVKEYVYDDEAEEGQIVSQDPPVDSSLNQNGKITVKVSMGKAPSVVNYTEDEAEAEFADDDAVSGIVVLGEVPSNEYEKGRVISQELQTSPGGETVVGVYLSSGLDEDEKQGRADERNAREETRPQETAVVIEREQPLRQPEPLRGSEGAGIFPSVPAEAETVESSPAAIPAETETEAAQALAETETQAPSTQAAVPESKAPSKPEPGKSESQGGRSTQPSVAVKADTGKTYTVSFSSPRGGRPKSQTVEAGDYVEEPDLEDVDGYNFVGWYQDSSYKNEWDFGENVVTKDLKLFAKWEKVEDSARSKANIDAAAMRESEAAARKERAEEAKKESEEAAKKESEEVAKKESEEAAKRESREAVKRESEEAAKKESEEASKKESEEAAKQESREAAKRESEAAAEKESEEAAKKESEEAAKQESREAAKRESEAAAEKESEEAAKKGSEEAAKQESREAAKRESEAAAKKESEEAAKRESEEAAQREAEEAAKKESEEAAQREAEEAAKRESEAAAKKESEEAAKRESEEAAQREAEEAAKRESEAAAKKESEEAAKRESEEAAQREAEEAARRESEAAAKKESEEAAKRESEEAAQREAEEAARRESEAAAKKESEEAAKRESEEAAQREAEEAARQKAEEEKAKSKQADSENEDEDAFDKEQGLIDQNQDKGDDDDDDDDGNTKARSSTRESTTSSESRTAQNNRSGNCIITFNMNGRGIALQQMSVKKGTKPVLPVPAAVAGYQFAGWYKDMACTLAWNAQIDTVTTNITLFAKWVTAGSAIGGTAGQQTIPETGGTAYTVPETDYTEAYTEASTEAYTEPETTAYTEPETTYQEPETEAYREPETEYEEPEYEDFEDFDDEEEFDEEY